ncbi:hypothetical protein OXPF_03060 [Oxobacter pfennigii]|uniref:DUF3231 family protein n=1 Tax=Oxobacter pfennigii TaxID=36849 RepID=A0A0P8YGN1_9CLOT|nr:DUF3231 family protein [Oxobacter pfennigii]KPU46196.1 hypothetical protein OXPF_03060 [Oxobacter pfennigii]
MDNVSHDTKNINLTSVEVGALWNTYMVESLVHHTYAYFLKHVDDPDIKKFLKHSHDTTREHLKLLEALFKEEKLPVPRGITSEDINPDAPRLFTDKYYIYFEEHMSRFALTSYSQAYAQCSRLDIRELFKTQFVELLILVNQWVTEVALSKGVYIRPPYVPLPKEVDFVKRQNFFSGFFGEKRSLTVLEITHLFNNADTNSIGTTQMTAYSQVAKSKDIRDYFIKGRDLAKTFYKNFVDVLISENIPIPPSHNSEITDSIESPFSDRLMLFHVNLLSSAGLSSYGMAITGSPRNDLSALYGKAAIESAAYAKEGASLMIEKGWMEQTPTAPDRDELAKLVKSH